MPNCSTNCAQEGFSVQPGDLGENVTTSGIDLLALPAGTGCTSAQPRWSRSPACAIPAVQIDGFQKGLMAATLDKDADGNLIRKAGIMSIVLTDGDVRPGDAVRVELPGTPYRPLQPVSTSQAPR